MSIILTTLNSKYIHTNLAIRYLKANAPEFDITLREYTLKDTLENILEDLLSRKPKIIGFSVYIWNVEKTLQLIKLLKEKDPTLTIFMGGPEVSYDFDVYPGLLFLYKQLRGYSCCKYNRCALCHLLHPECGIQ